MNLLTTAEARRTGKLDSPEYAMACQIRFVCAIDTKEGRERYLALVAYRDGKEHADNLRAKAREYWNSKKG